MSHNQRIRCPVCAASNEPDALYCKICGAEMTGARPGEDAGSPPEAAGFEGISAADAAVCIGPGAARYVKKFLEMERRHTRAGWNWPVILLAFFCGPAALSLWFFYRKMYKPAGLFLSAGLLLLAANTLIRYAYSVQFFTLFLERIGPLFSDGLSYGGLSDFITHTTPAAANGSLTYVLYAMLTAGVFVCKMVVAVFANGIYKRHVARCVKAAPAGEDRPARLRAAGGVNPAAAAGAAVGVALAFLLAMAAPLLGALGIFPA